MAVGLGDRGVMGKSVCLIILITCNDISNNFFTQCRRHTIFYTTNLEKGLV